MSRKSIPLLILSAVVLIFAGCDGDTGPVGPTGQDGRNGTNGTDGIDGANALLLWETWDSQDFQSYPWAFGGSADWILDLESVPVPGGVSGHSTVNALACSGPISHSQGSQISVDVDLPTPGVVAFRARVSSERGYDHLYWYVDGNRVAGICGESGGIWTDFRFAIAEGPHTLAWSYTKDSSVNNGLDRGDVDDIRIFLVNGTLAPSFADVQLPEGVSFAGDFNPGVK